jgi:eukaryotic-like serine/threonine-protein kinase
VRATPPGRQARADWPRVDAALDELLALPAEGRAAAIARMAGDDLTFAEELHSLAAHLDNDDALLDHPAADALSGAAVPAPGLAAGTRLGPWRVVALIGRGGMGEVYRAERADGQFEQQVAIKLVRLDAAAHGARFRAERQIVARLDHPGIARLLDGDVSSDGRPYMVMELVTGVQLMDWCLANAPSLERRLTLFVDICEAVAYAHRNLIVHRDLKPANVMVANDGRIKLLDFGIARLTDAPSDNLTQELLLTPAYAAPEQLNGGPITTAADVHALGLLLHELLCERTAYPVQDLPLAAAMQQVLTQQARAPSRVALDDAAPPIAPARLAGDLDAIVAKALRKEPVQRYASVDDLRNDVERHVRHEPVLARRGKWTYVAGRMLRRHRAWALGGSMALAAVVAATGAVAWQARVARDEAARATAVKNLLLQVFKASDPRVASDKPRGQTTARELLDAGAGRIEREFASEPDLLVEQLSVIASIYRDLGEEQRSSDIQGRLIELARQHPGRYVAAEIDMLMSQVDDLLAAPNRPQAREGLARLDPMIHDAGLDESAVRAVWWMESARAEEPDRIRAQQTAYERSLALFDRVAPRDSTKVTLLGQMARLELGQEHFGPAAARYEEALRASEVALDRDDGATGNIWAGLGVAAMNLGRSDEALDAFRKAALISQRTYGPGNRFFWSAQSQYAKLLHMMGHRDEAMRAFEELRSVVPDPPNSASAADALSLYAQVLAAQGSLARALPWLEAEVRFQELRPDAPFALRKARLNLGDAYAGLARATDAGRLLSQAYADYVAHDPRPAPGRMAATERWGRFLLDKGDLEEARHLFRAVVLADAGRNLTPAVNARVGLARAAIAAGDTAVALQEGRAAITSWHEVQGMRDVRTGAYVARTQARVLLLCGDKPAARDMAAAALAESLRYDAPEAASIAEARALVAQAR